MKTTGEPVEYGDFHTLDIEGLDWWARMVCFQVGQSSAAFLLQDNMLPVKGIYAGVYDHTTEMVLAILSGVTLADIGGKMAQSTDDDKPEYEINVAARKAVRLLKEGALNDVIIRTCQERELSYLCAGTDDEAYAQFIGDRLESLKYTKEIRHADNGTPHYVWSRRIL